MSRARMKLDPGERLLLAARPHPALLIPALLRALGVLVATAVLLALLLRSSAPHGVRIALDLPVIALAARSVFRFARAVWQWDRSLLALTTRRVFVVAPRGRLRRAWETMPLSAIRTSGVEHSFGGRLLGYGTLTLGDGPSGHEIRFVSDAERVAEAFLDASPQAGRTWTQIEGPAVSEQPAPRSRLA
jgi:Bacterial PH domain